MTLSLETLDQLAALALGLCAAGSAGTGIAILSFRAPARARVVEDGARRASHDRNAAVFMRERAPMPLIVEDFVSYVAQDGRERRASLARWSWAAPPSLVWYAPADPARVTGLGPLKCFGWCLAAVATLIWLRW